MKLLELDAEFLRWERHADGHVYLPTVDHLADAMGVVFLCPKCLAAMGGKRGVHSVICWSSSRGTPAIASPGPGRWKMDGTGLADLTLNAETVGGQRSVQLTGGCAWHGFVTNGDAT
jgi:hypothetical protein